MPYKNSEKAKADARVRKIRHRKKKHAEKYGPGAGNQQGKHRNHSSGSNHYRWNETLVRTDGYSLTRVGTGHPLEQANGYALVHWVVWVSAGNEKPGPGEVLHHINEDREDNRIENLRLMTNSEHRRMHAIEEQAQRRERREATP